MQLQGHYQMTFAKWLTYCEDFGEQPTRNVVGICHVSNICNEHEIKFKEKFPYVMKP